MEAVMYSQYVKNLFHFAAAGDIDKVEMCVKVVHDINIRNEKGWTALMFAARNGHKDIVKFLINKGCDVDIINRSGQTAADIADFWNHSDVVELLRCSGNSSRKAPDALLGVKAQQKPMYFTSSPLARASHRRKDKKWLEHQMGSSRSKFIIFVALQPLCVTRPDRGVEGNNKFTSKVLTLNVDQIREILDGKPLVIFLGLENVSSSQERDGVAWFAVDLEHLSSEQQKRFDPQSQLFNSLERMLTLQVFDAAVVSQARSILAWHDRYRFCPTCGSKTVIEDAGYKRTCCNKDCRSRQGNHNTSHPRIDPSVIMAVISPDGKRLLLANGKGFPTCMYSCLSGFMEPGENLQDAVIREVSEESGIIVDHVEYYNCQHWPMPSTLIIGCFAYATNTDISIDPEEINDAQWFTKRDIVKMLTRQHHLGLWCPSECTIAHHLIRSWTLKTSNL